jgi:MSHA biogenesis protein MshN
MSLINKMLQDLDARGGSASGQLHQPELKAVPSGERDRKPLLMLGGAAVFALLVAGGWMGWKYWQGRVAATAPAAVGKPAKMIVIAPAAPSAATVATPPAAAVVPAAPAAVADAGNTEAPTPTSAAEAPKRHARVRAERAERAERAGTPSSAGMRVAPLVTGSGNTVRDLGPEQMSENTYRRALVALQEGRVSESLADLERALDINPRNEAARQTYISLLLENKRPDEAIRQLRLALGIDPRQPGLALVLARLQLERGGPALETLMKTLPYAGNSGEYHAFVAGVLQKQQRNPEAIEQYEEALKLSPQNGVWWMGLGISLQAEKRLPEAREAYLRAKSGNGLSAELQAFVTRKLDQLTRTLGN